MCGVVSMAAARACAGSTLSSNTMLACLVFQSTATDFTPRTRLSEFCTVLVHGGQCSPVTRNVPFVGFAASWAYKDAAEISPRPIVADMIETDSRMAFSPRLNCETESGEREALASRYCHRQAHACRSPIRERIGSWLDDQLEPAPRLPPCIAEPAGRRAIRRPAGRPVIR